MEELNQQPPLEELPPVHQPPQPAPQPLLPQQEPLPQPLQLAVEPELLFTDNVVEKDG